MMAMTVSDRFGVRIDLTLRGTVMDRHRSIATNTVMSRVIRVKQTCGQPEKKHTHTHKHNNSFKIHKVQVLHNNRVKKKTAGDFVP